MDHTPAWTGRRRAEALRQVKARGSRENLQCSVCKLPIDYSLTYPHPQSCSVQHVLSQADYPALRWDSSNWEPAHLDCNKQAGRGIALGVTSGW